MQNTTYSIYVIFCLSKKVDIINRENTKLNYIFIKNATIIKIILKHCYNIMKNCY